MTRRLKWALVMGVAVLAAIWLGGGLWRIGESYWTLRLSTSAFGDEGREWVYSQIGAHGGDGAYLFLVDALEEELADGGNDVVLSGIIRGMVSTGDPRAERDLVALFRRYADEPPDGKRYIAIQAALGLQELSRAPLSMTVDEASPYSKFAVSTSNVSPAERSEADRRFAELAEEITSRFGRSE